MLAERGDDGRALSVLEPAAALRRLPGRRMRRAGVRVALGSDAASCNDRLDPFREMRLAALLPAHGASRPRALAAFDALRMATWDGAARPRPARPRRARARRPRGLRDPGSRRPAGRCPEAWNDEPYGAIVYSMGRENVFATIVDGVVRYRAGDATVGGLKPSAEEVRAAVRKLLERMKK